MLNVKWCLLQFSAELCLRSSEEPQTGGELDGEAGQEKEREGGYPQELPIPGSSFHENIKCKLYG